MAAGSDVSGHPAAGVVFLSGHRRQSATGETQHYDRPRSSSRDTTGAGEMNKLSWLPVSGATGLPHLPRHAEHRPARTSSAAQGRRAAGAIVLHRTTAWMRSSAANPPGCQHQRLDHVPASRSSRGSLNVINFGRTGVGDEPVAWAPTAASDYDYYLGRRDMIYATTSETQAAGGRSGGLRPSSPILPEGTLGAVQRSTARPTRWT
ncbi:MAG: hypothetical protein MZV70_52265 [Desulfobacterales bacterium]|nr:hypothetical protein [Desulfobacterales bacterium]